MPKAELTSVSDFIMHAATRQRRHRTWIVLAMTGIVLVTAMLMLISEAVYPQSAIGKFAENNAAAVAALMGALIGYVFGRAIEERPSATTTVERGLPESISLYEELVRANEKSLEQQKRILELEAALAKHRDRTPTA